MCSLDSTIEVQQTNTCIINENEDIHCFLAHSDSHGLSSDAPTEIDGKFDFVTNGENFACSLDSTTQETTCWGNNNQGAVNNLPQENVFKYINSGEYFSCGIDAIDGSIRCWGQNDQQQVSEPPEDNNFIMISAGKQHACAIDVEQAIHCWGRNDKNQVRLSL
jgi:alpha-tubulin suppressor-like RCC1 family protein